MKENKVYAVQKNEIRDAAFTLFQAFQQDPFMRWVFITEENYYKNALAVIETWVKYSILYGWAWRTEHFESVALRLKPGDLQNSFWRFFRSGMLKTPKLMGKESFRRLMFISNTSQKIKKEQMKNHPFIYCWFLGTKPELQGQGFGSTLMKKTFSIAEQLGVDCYLETGSDRSKKIHMSQGYQTLQEYMTPDKAITITVMLKNYQLT
ncbi:N-acetyltransferase [Legionella israelensis]|uniref:N-acetyltransferase n=1 Tax=Legionella israelensis TaxID=454 RepID=A0AAX1EGI2_9GAMM|nr:GNAT family N-acetyltransferase [Legionella israelensis]QBR84179.1 N-acetyltransferase [Legionella israelensis]